MTNVAAPRTVDAFIERVMQDLLTSLPNGGADTRAALEDAVLLLSDYRLCDMDGPALERLIASLRQGRAPVRIDAASARRIGDELARRWAQVPV